MAMNTRRNPLSALLDYATARGDEASSIGSVMSQLASPILKGQGVQVDDAVQRGPVPQPTLVEFNTTSKARLAGADPRLSDFMTEVERRASGQGINMQIAETNRSPERQAELVASGKSQTQNSHHLTGNAADIYLVGPDGKPNYNFDDYKPVADIAKEVAAERGMADFQWGGDWTTLKDGVHFQLGGAPNLNTTVSTMGGPETGGALPQTVEGILSTLYPNAAEDEKAARRKDIFRGLSQGFAAISQGNPVDLSNIAANADTRRRQNVLDMRDRERARAGAALIYSQTGDADMAGAVAGGLMSLNDVFSERERKRLAEQADAQRLKTEQANDALGGLVRGMTGEFGFSEKRTAEIAAALDAGADPSTVLTLTEQAKVADEARKKEEAAATAREKRDALAEEYANSEDPLLRLTGQLMLGNPDVSMTDAYKVASDRFPVANEGGDKGFEFQAKIAARMKSLNEDEATATRAVLEQEQKAGATNLTIGPDGKITVTQGAVGAPAAGGAPAVGGAGVTDLGTTAPGTVTALTSTGELINAPIPGAPQPAQTAADLAATEANTAQTLAETTAAVAAAPTELAAKQTDLDLKQQDLAARRAVAPDAIAKSALDVEAANLANEQAALDLQIAQEDQSVDADTKAANLAIAQQQVRTAQQTYDTAVVTANKATADAKIASSKNYITATNEYERFSAAAQAVYDQGLDAMTTGTMGQIYDFTLGQMLESTPRRAFKVKVGAMSSQLTFDALMEAKAAGITLNPMTEEDRKQFSNSMSLLGNAGELDGETIVRETAFQDNMAKDFLYGPKDLTRHDEFGQPYQVGAPTLGVTEDTFARHWKNIPPAVKEAWRSGSVATLPVDDPAYAEAAKVINAMETNFKLYQPNVPLDRSIIGIPVPEGVEPELWPEIWAGLSADSKAELTQAAK